MITIPTCPHCKGQHRIETPASPWSCIRSVAERTAHRPALNPVFAVDGVNGEITNIQLNGMEYVPVTKECSCGGNAYINGVCSYCGPRPVAKEIRAAKRAALVAAIKATCAVCRESWKSIPDDDRFWSAVPGSCFGHTCQELRKLVVALDSEPVE